MLNTILMLIYYEKIENKFNIMTVHYESDTHIRVFPVFTRTIISVDFQQKNTDNKFKLCFNVMFL